MKKAVKKQAAAKTLESLKPVTKTSHVQISSQAFCEMFAAWVNNMHNNEGKSLPVHTLVAYDDASRQTVATTNMVRVVDQARMLVNGLAAVFGKIYEGQSPELYKDRGPRVERLDQQ